jgi:hypothetical protein
LIKRHSSAQAPLAISSACPTAAYVTQGETTMATAPLTFNTGQTAILMADFHRERMGDNPIGGEEDEHST